MGMIVAPTTWEWTFVYAPAGAVLVVACVAELLSGRISNWLSVVTFLYLLGARLSHSPAEFPWSLLSLLVAAIVVIGYGWKKGYLGGGAAKLAVAVCSGLPPWMAVCVSCGLVLFGLIMEHTHRWHGVARVPGSVVITLLVAVTVGLATVFGSGGIA
jgi:Flp pilus assembly protein protease CpaA